MDGFAHNIFAAAAEHFQGFGVALDNAVMLHQQNGVTGLFKEHPVALFVVGQNRLSFFANGNVGVGSDEALGRAIGRPLDNFTARQDPFIGSILTAHAVFRIVEGRLAG